MLIFGLASCSPVTLVKPLEKNQMAFLASLGGPMIVFSNVPIPIPFCNAGFSYGINARVTASAQLGLTSLAFGVIQMDPGILYGIRIPENNHQIGISAFLKTHLLLDKWEGNFRWYPETGIQAYKEWDRNMVYAGASGWFETRFPAEKRAAENMWVPMLNLGYTRQKTKWNLTAEAKWIAPNINKGKIVVDFIGPGTNGALGLYVGLVKKF
jgi:hypothetical protein